MSDYTLLEYVLSLGGQVVEVEDTRARWKRHASGEGAPRIAGEGSHDVVEPSTLSTAHIRPFIEYRAGGSLLKTSKGQVSPAVGGGQRGAVKGFSDNSRRRLLRTIGGIKRHADLPLFITLTYPEQFPNPSESKKHLKMMFQRLGRKYSDHGSIWKLEPQERGAPHYHILTWGVSLEKMQEYIPSIWFDIAGAQDKKHLSWHRGELGNGNKHCVQQVNSWRGVWSYASKYLGKTFEVSGWNELWTGRYWGVINRDNVPFGELVQQEVDIQKVVEVQRYQRRFTRIKKTNKSMTIFCDAQQWVDKLDL